MTTAKTITIALKLILFSMLGGSMIACSKTGSSNVKTKGMYVSFSVNGNNSNSATCRAQFQVGGPTGTYLELEEGDTVTCQGLPMSKSEFAGIVTYSAAVNYSVGGTYMVTFSRPQEAAYVSTVTLPSAIMGMNPSTFASYQKGQPLSVSWTPSSNSADEMWVELSFSTGQGSHYIWERGGQPELGAMGFSAQDTNVNPPVAGTFSGNITYERSRSGFVPGPLSGSIVGRQTVSAPIQLRD